MAVPVFDYLASVDRPLTVKERAVNAALVDFFNHILSSLNRHGTLEALIAEQYRSSDNIIEDMRDDLRFMKDTPVFDSCLSTKTREAIEKIIMMCDGQSALIDTSRPVKVVHLYPEQLISNNVATGSSEAKAAGSIQRFHQCVNEFRAALTNNKYINLDIQLRRYKMLKRLEQGVKADKRKYKGSVNITWESLVKRMAVYARDRCSDVNAVEDEKSNDGVNTCKLIFRLLRDYLVHARSYPMSEDGHRLLDANGDNDFNHPAAVSLKLMPPDQLTEKERQVYYDKQLNLLDNGAVHLLLDVIMMRNIDEEEGGIADICFDVLDEIQLGGNNAVRETIYEYMVYKDVDGRVLRIIAYRMNRCMRDLSECKNMGALGAKGEFINSDADAVLEESIQIVQLLVNFCVDHYSNFQHLLREQPMYSEFSCDLIAMCIKLLCDMVESQKVVEMFSIQEVQLVRKILQFLIVSMLGPCPENQVKISKSDVSIALNSIIAATCDQELVLYEADPSFVNMQALSFKVLSACLEARNDNECQKALKGHVDINLLCECAVSVDSDIRSLMGVAASWNRLLNEEESERVRVKLDALAQIWIVHHEFFPEMSQRLSVLQASKKVPSYASLQNKNTVVDTAVSTEENKEEEKLDKILDAMEEIEDSAQEMKFLKSKDDEESDGKPRRRSFVEMQGDENGEDDENEEEEEEEDEDLEPVSGGPLQSFHAPLIGVVEVMWKGKVYRTCFPLPLASKYLTKKTKAGFLMKVTILLFRPSTFSFCLLSFHFILFLTFIFLTFACTF